MRPGADDDIDASPQLTCAIINSAGETTTENVIFVTRDPDYNQVSVQIGLTSGSTILTPGTIPDPLSPPGPDEGTTIYVDLNALGLSAEVWDQLTFHGQGWTFQKFSDQGVVGMTPVGSPIPLDSGTAGTIPIEVRGIVVPEAPPIPQIQIYVVYYNIPTVPGNYSTLAVALQKAPDEHDGDLSTVIGASLSANGIINTPGPQLKAANRFALQFTNLGGLVPAGPDTTFSVTFVYGAPNDAYGYGALTDVASANDFLVRRGDNATNWTITPDKNAQAVTWTLLPPEGAPIVGTGGQSVVAINFSNVVTTYQPGPTVMLVSYCAVPGYKDGTFTLVLNKIPHVSIGSLEVTPNPTYFRADGSAKVTVRWKVAAPQSLELTQNYLTTPVTGLTERDATLEAESTVFALRATGRPGTVDNSDYRTVNAIALPVINSFTGAPAEIYHGTLAHDASFDWAVDSASDVRLYSTGTAFNGQSYTATNNTSAAIFETQMVSLVPKSLINRITLTRRLVFSAFKPVPEKHTLPFTPGAAAASPSGPFVILAGPSTSLTVVDTVRYTPSSTYELGHAASALAFSADGTILATANTDRTVSIVGVDLGASGMPTFTNLSTITLSHAPQQLVFSPNRQRIFLTLDPDGDEPGRVLALVRSQNGYEIEGPPVTVGRRPRGLTLDAAGARLFVANSGDQTVTMIGLARTGKLGSSSVLSGFAGRPTGIAATPSGRQLLVSCASTDDATGTVVVIDPSHPETGQRSTLPAGGSPGQIALLPSGSYAAVANGENGTVTLIDCWGRPAEAAIPGPPIAAATRPTGITASPDGQQVLVAVDGGFCVVTLATYQASTTMPAMPNRPTSVAVTTDGESVFAWHDMGIAPKSSPGVLVYDTTSRTTTNLLADRDVLRLVVSPDPLAKEAFAIIKDDPALYRVAVDSLDTQTYPLGLPSGTTPVALTVSGDGEAVYVVAADAGRDLTLVVLEEHDNTWTVAQTLPLYRMAAQGRILLRSTPDGTTLFVVDTTAAQVGVLRRTGSSYVLSPTKITGEIRAHDLAVAPDGSTAYVLNAGLQTNTITVVDVASLNSRIAPVPQSYVNLTALQPSPDGRRLFATDTNAAALRVFDPRSLRIIQTIPLAAGSGQVRGITGLAVAADGSAVFTANADSQNLGIVEQIQMGTTTTTPSARLLLRSPLAATYSGLFLRHYLGEQPGSPKDGWSASPDVIPYGKTTEPNPSVFTTPEGYAKDCGRDVALLNDNYVYVRGRNVGTAEITSRVYFYYTPGALALWPANWRSDKVSVNDVERNWVDVTAPPNGVGVGASPFVWIPDDLDPATDHYCVIAWAADGPNPQPPDLARFSKFATLDDLVNFIVTHHNVAWRNTHQYRTPPPNYTYSTALSTAAGGAAVYLQVGFKDVPLDGTFSVNLQGTDTSNSVSLEPSPLERFQGGFMPRNNPLPLPGNFATSLRVQYWQGATPPPETAQIKVVLLGGLPPAMVSDIERLYRPIGLRTPIVRLNQIPTVVVGSAQFELKFGKARKR
jgi:DNA-binding beta-propeller fold protein YncE